MLPFFSIIIPFKKIDTYVAECIKWCNNQRYRKFEIILLPDEGIDKTWIGNKKIKIIITGKCYPSKKRNIGIRNAKGNIFAFIDSDAYPKKNWLKNSIKYFKDPCIAAVGGPNIPPSNDPLLNQISGKIISNVFATGVVAKRFKVLKGNYFASELSASNLMIRKDVMESIGCFDEKYLTGEDAKVCFLISQMGKKIVYARDVKVFHHQRAWLFSYLKQIWTWGCWRGTLLSKKEVEQKIGYFIPFLFLLFLLLGSIASLLIKPFSSFYTILLVLYALTALAFSLKEGVLFPLVFIGIILTHITYATGLLFGLLKGVPPRHLS